MPKIGLIGPGRLGRSLAAALPQDRYPIGPVASSDRISAKKAVRELRRGYPVDSLGEMADADYLLVTSPEGTAEHVVDRLAATPEIGRKIVFYCDPSVRIPLEPWDGSYACRVSPLRNFTFAIDDLTDVYFFVDGHPTAVRYARSLLRDCGARVVASPAGSGPRVTAAAAAARETVTAVLDFAVELLVASGLPHKRAMEAMQPLIAGALTEYARGRGRARGAVRANSLPTALDELKRLDAERGEVYERILDLTRAVSERDCKQDARANDGDDDAARGMGAGAGKR